MIWYYSIIVWPVLFIKTERWFSANLFGNEAKLDWNEEPETRFVPLNISVKENKLINRGNVHMKNEVPIYKANVPWSENSIVVRKTFNNSINKNPPLYDLFAVNVNNEHIYKPNRPNLLQINNTITNVNFVNRIRPKRRYLRKCPESQNREKKQLDFIEKGKRFLEIFEVVEFDHAPCMSSSGLDGICLPEQTCRDNGGSFMGSCADGFGTCCVNQFSCDGNTKAPVVWFTNPGFPSPSIERLSCTVTLAKSSNNIKQIRLEFNNFELLPPSAGLCEQDQFIISGQNINNQIPILCGVNTGHHIYIEVGNVGGPINLSVQTISADVRLFSIKITQLTEFDDMAAPTGCLQYFKGTKNYIESFNYRDKSDIGIPRISSYLNNLNYAICIERSPESCSLTYTNIGDLQIVNYDADGLPIIPPQEAGVEVYNCPSDWLLISAIRLCGERLNDGSVLQDFTYNAPVTDTSAGPIVVWFRSDGTYVGRGFKLEYKQNACITLD